MTTYPVNTLCENDLCKLHLRTLPSGRFLRRAHEEFGKLNKWASHSTGAGVVYSAAWLRRHYWMIRATMSFELNPGWSFTDIWYCIAGGVPVGSVEDWSQGAIWRKSNENICSDGLATSSVNENITSRHLNCIIGSLHIHHDSHQNTTVLPKSKKFTFQPTFPGVLAS